MIRFFILALLFAPSLLLGCEPDIDLLISWRDELISAPDTPEEEPDYLKMQIDAMTGEVQQSRLGYIIIENDPCKKSVSRYFDKPKSKNLSKHNEFAQKCKFEQVPDERDINAKANSKIWRSDFSIPYCLTSLLREHFNDVKQRFVEFFAAEISPNRLRREFTLIVDDESQCPYAGGQPFLACFKLDRIVVIHPKLVRAELINLLELAGRLRLLKRDVDRRPKSYTKTDKKSIHDSIVVNVNSFKNKFDFLFAHELTHAYFKSHSGEFFADCMALVYIRKIGRPEGFGVWNTLKAATDTPYIGGELQKEDVELFKTRFRFIESLPTEIDFEFCVSYWGKRSIAPLKINSL